MTEISPKTREELRHRCPTPEEVDALLHAHDKWGDLRICEICDRKTGEEVPETMVCTRCWNDLAQAKVSAVNELDKALVLLRECRERLVGNEPLEQEIDAIPAKHDKGKDDE